MRRLHAVTVTAILGIAIALRAPGLAPSSLWLDDAWTALAYRAETVSDMLLVAVTAPGFVLATSAVLRGVGFSEIAAQALPFVAGVAAPVLLYAVAVRRGAHALGALAGAMLLAASPVLAVYSTRVKHYSLDALLAVALLALAWALVAAPTRPARWLLLAAAGIAATVLSAGVAPVVGAALVAGLVALLRERPVSRRDLGWAVGSGAAYGAFGVVWAATVVLPGVTEGLRGYWADRYVEAPGDVWRLAGAFLEGVVAAPPALTAIALFVGAVVAAHRNPPLAIAGLLPLLVAIVLATARVAPFGTGRTDAYLYPGIALVVAVAVSALVDDRRLVAGAVLVAAAALVVATAVRVDLGYPEQDTRPLIAQMEQSAAPEDALLIYPSAVWAYALYTDAAIGLEPHAREAGGFRPVFVDPRVVVLGRHRDDPDAYVPEVEEAAAGASRIWFLASHWRGDIARIEEALVERGWRRVEEWRQPGARLDLWEEEG